MNLPTRLFAASVLAGSCLVPMSSFAQASAEHDHSHGAAASAVSATPLTEGEVRKVDLKASKVTLKHGEIKHLDMPPMTMVFAVQDSSLLEKLNPGDKVKFTAVSEKGKLIVTSIQPLR